MEYNYVRLFELLKKRKITFAKMKRDLRLTKTEVWQLENNAPLRMETMFLICQYLRVDIRDIMEIDGQLV